MSRIHRLICCFLFLSSAACGGFSTAGLLAPQKADAGSPGPVDTTASGGGAANGDNGPVLDLGSSQDAGGISSEAASPAADGSSDATSVDSSPPGPGPRDRDGQAADVATAANPDASTPCAELTACCGRLIIAPPLAAACYAPTVQGDAGNASSCMSTLGDFRDAGLCP